jgi:hypothetical protein
MPTPYRDHAIEKAPKPRTELQCELRDVPKSEGLQRVMVGAVLVALAVVLSFLWLPAGVIFVVAVVAWARFVMKPTAKLLLRIDDGKLVVVLGDVKNAQPLGCVTDVRLDSKPIKKSLNQPRSDGLNWIGGSAIMGGPSIDLDVSRVEIVLDNGAPMRLGEHMSRTRALDVMREVRLFLRSHGWLPLDERPEESDVVLPRVKKKKSKKDPSSPTS